MSGAARPAGALNRRAGTLLTARPAVLAGHIVMPPSAMKLVPVA